MPYSLGLDFGTESARAILVNCEIGEEVAQAVSNYKHGVIDETLSVGGKRVRLKPDSALQDPEDYLKALKEICARVLRDARVAAKDVIGIGVDFTASTIIPVKKNGTPLCVLKQYRAQPNAWVKLWKHHGAAAEAEQILDAARKRREPFLPYFGGAISSEWLLPKALEILHESPPLYKAADCFVEGGDWLVWQLTGRLVRNSTAAGYKGMWVHAFGFPSDDFLRAVDPRLVGLYTKKVAGPHKAPGERAGTLTKEMAKQLGLREGTPVSAATIDAHAGVPGCGVVRPNIMTIISGTSQCHMMLSREPILFEGFAGLVKDGITKGYYGYESGQTAVGDIFAWFVDHGAPPDIVAAAAKAKRSVYVELEARAEKLKAGESGLLALDWWKGNRSVLMDARLSGLILGLTLDTRPEQTYRALVEATAFGTRKIVQGYTEAGVPVEQIIMCGGLVERSPMFTQICADVLNRPIQIAASSQTVALGAAMFGALAAGKAAGGFDDIEEAAAKMVRPPKATYKPSRPAARTYNRLYALYEQLHDYFGRTVRIMHDLRELAQSVS